MGEFGPDRSGAPIGRVDQPLVHARSRRSGLDGGRTTAIVAALLVGLVATYLGLRSSAAEPEDAAQPSSSAQVAAASSDPTDPPDDGSTAGPESASPATTEPSPPMVLGTATPTQTKSPPLAAETNRPDPGPTDAPHPTWSPPAVFAAAVWFERQCQNGTTYDMVFIEWASPVPIAHIHLWLDGTFKGVTWFASGAGPQYESRHGASQSVTFDASHVASATFFDVDNKVVAGPIDSAPYTPAAISDPC